MEIYCHWVLIYCHPSHLLDFDLISICWIMKDWLLTFIITRHYSYKWKNTLVPKPSIQLHKTLQKNYPLGWNYLCFILLMLCSPNRSNLFLKSITMLFGGGVRNTFKSKHTYTHTHKTKQNKKIALLQNVILWSLEMACNYNFRLTGFHTQGAQVIILGLEKFH